MPEAFVDLLVVGGDPYRIWLILLQTNNANEVIFNQFIRYGIALGRAEIQTYSDRNIAN